MAERTLLPARTSEVKRADSLKVKKADRFQSMRSPADRILFLQRTIGNQAVQNLIKSETLQANKRKNPSGDIYKQENQTGAYRARQNLSEEAVQTLIQKQEEEEEQIQTRPANEQILPLVQRQVEEEEELQTKTTSGRIPEVQPDIESQIHSLKGGGQPLSENDRAFFEPRFSRDFSQVRMHTDTRAAESAWGVNARAFTVGKNLFFGKGQYVPKTTTGKKLLAHELTHTIQHINKAGKKDETAIEHMGTFVAKKQNTIRLMRQLADAGVPSDAGVPVPNETGESDQYRDLQVACVIRLGGCSNRRPGGIPTQDEITSYNTSCRRESTYRGQDITPSDAECADPPRPESISSALRFARRLNDIYPGWLDALPNCPCKDREARGNPSTWEGPNACMDTYHPGAKTGFRSTSGYSSVAGTSHGQQCCYDKDGALITKGEAAGTPDSVAPIGVLGTFNHYLDDVRTFNTLGWQVYNQYWIPNKGKNCPVEGKVPSKPPVTPTPPVSPTSIPKDIQIFFKYNRPKPGESGKEHLNNSLTIIGRKQLERLVAQIRQNPTFRVQLVGKTSPEGTSKFNLDLGARRAKIIAEALINEGIDRTRLMNQKVSECKVLGEGLITCGEAGATSPSDRQVLAKIFFPKI